MVMPRVYFAMARDGLFFPAAAALHSRYHTPARAIAIRAMLASLLAVLGTFDEILAYFIVPTVVFVGLTVAAVFVLGRGARNTEEPVSMPWHPIPPLLFLVPTAVLLALMAISNSRSLECHSSWFAHFDSDSLNRHHPDVEKDLRYGLQGPEPARF